MNFCSDNVTGVAPEIMRALAAANQGSAAAYANDDLTTRVKAAMSAFFETDVAVFMTPTGTAANALALSALTPSYGAVFCHRGAHIDTSECGAPVFYTQGARLIPVDGDHGRMDLDRLERAITAPRHPVDHPPPFVISLTVATEVGTVYRRETIAAIGALARRHGLKLHMDGARFANALATLGCSPAELTWRAGVDALSFGATKNGAMNAEAVVAFDPGLASALAYRHKRAGLLLSKSRFIAAQWDAYLADGLWLRNARHANAMARRLADGLAAIPGARLPHPTEINEVFVELPEPMILGLLVAGFAFFRRGGPQSTLIRLVTAFDTRVEDVDTLLDAAHRLAAGAVR